MWVSILADLGHYAGSQLGMEVPTPITLSMHAAFHALAGSLMCADK